MNQEEDYKKTFRQVFLPDGLSNMGFSHASIILIRIFFVLILFSSLFITSPFLAQGPGYPIHGVDKYAWSANGGWINHSSIHGPLTVYDSHLEGHAWSESIGWIRMGTHTGGGHHTYSNNSPSDFGVNNNGGSLSGFAWSANAGWINFDPEHGGVTIDLITGEFSGFAWSESIGWICFSGIAADSTPYKVRALYSDAYRVYLHSYPEDIDVILTGDGNYLQGQPVVISASFGDEYLFLEWTGEHQALLDDPFNSSAGFIMPSHDVEFTALFETQKFFVTFTVIDENLEAIEGAIINIGKSGTTLITDTDGTAFDEFFPGTYHYSVSKEGHITQTGLSFNVTNQDLMLDPVILPIDTEHAYRVSFIVTDSVTGDPMYKTKILIVSDGQIWKDLTDMDGRAEFYLQNGSYEYTARAGYAYSLVTGGFTVDGHAIEDIAVNMISSVWNAAISIAHPWHEGTFLWAYNEAKSNMISARNSNWKRLIVGSAAKKLMVDDINNDGRLEIIGSFEEHGLWSFEAVSMEWRILYPICPDEWTIANTPEGRQIIASFIPNGIFRIPVYRPGTQFISIPIFKRPADILEAANIDMDGEGIDELLVSFADYGLFIYDFHHNTFIRVVSVAPSNIITGDITGDGHNDIVSTFPEYGTYIGTFIPSKKGPIDLKDKYPFFDIENNKAGKSYNKQGLQWQRILFITPDQGIGTANIIQDNPGHEIIISHAQRTYYYRFDTSRWYSKPGLAPFDTLISGHFTGNTSHDLIISQPDTDRIYLWINSDNTLMLLYDGLSEGDIRSMAAIE